MSEKKCPECGAVIVGRSDKKFCSDQCRNAYHNNLRAPVTNYMRQVNNILRKNRTILETLNPTGKMKVHKNRLIALGFNFSYFTNVLTTKDGKAYYFCYEQGYLPLPDDFFFLVRKATKEYHQ